MSRQRKATQLMISADLPSTLPEAAADFVTLFGEKLRDGYLTLDVREATLEFSRGEGVDIPALVRRLTRAGAKRVAVSYGPGARVAITFARESAEPASNLGPFVHNPGTN
jgi:hypothetical protein